MGARDGQGLVDTHQPTCPLLHTLLLRAQVGAGALGCEFLKNFAMMGIACSDGGASSSGGCVTVRHGAAANAVASPACMDPAWSGLPPVCGVVAMCGALEGTCWMARDHMGPHPHIAPVCLPLCPCPCR